MSHDATPASEDGLWDEVNAWLEQHWDPDLSVDEWWQLVFEHGWTAPHFATDEYGRGLSRRAIAVARSAFNKFGALMPPAGLGLTMAAPTILAHGTPDQIARHVPPILNGQLAWCQLFSEPGAGSDLAGLTTRAERDGDHWVITGQKVWSSQAHESDYGMLLARTNPDVPKHAGISWFAFALDQPGVEVRPLREMTGHAVFNEVFIDEAVCADADLIGGEGNGWTVTQSTLFFERTGIGAGGGHAGFPPGGPKGGMLGRKAGDAAQDRATMSNLTLSADDVIALAKRLGRTDDPEIRQDIARLISYSHTGRWNAIRSRSDGQVASIGKLAQTRIVKLAAHLATDLLGAAGMLAGPDGVEAGRYAESLVFSPASSIYGGSDEIQRNIVSERVLGLPREPAPDKGLPFAEAQRRIAEALAQGRVLSKD